MELSVPPVGLPLKISVTNRQGNPFGSRVVFAYYMQFGGLIRRGDTHKGYRPINLSEQVRFLLPPTDRKQEDEDSDRSESVNQVFR